MHIIHIGEGNGNPLQYSCLENPMDGRACWATVHGVTKSRTRLSDFTFTFNIHMGFPGGTSGKEFICQSRRHKRSGLDLDRDLQISGLGRPTGGSHGNPLQYSCLEYAMDRGAWQVTVHRFNQSQTQLKQLSTHIIHMFT